MGITHLGLLHAVPALKLRVWRSESAAAQRVGQRACSEYVLAFISLGSKNEGRQIHSSHNNMMQVFKILFDNYITCIPLTYFTNT